MSPQCRLVELRYGDSTSAVISSAKRSGFTDGLDLGEFEQCNRNFLSIRANARVRDDKSQVTPELGKGPRPLGDGITSWVL